MAAQINILTRFEVEHCYKCGVPFAMTEEYRRRKLDDGSSFFCVNGHSQHYTESSVQRLQKQLNKEKTRREWAEDAKRRAHEEAETERRRAAAARGQTTKLKNRIKNGVCPCCNRTFQNLAKHMKSQHPDYIHQAQGGGE